MEGVRPELARIRGLRIFAAFLYSGDVEHIDRLIRELQDSDERGEAPLPDHVGDSVAGRPRQHV